MLKFLLISACAVAIRPRLWMTALRQMRNFAPNGWWREPPFLPLPGRSLMRFRAEAMYGNVEAVPKTSDIVDWLVWCRDLSR